ncbi:class I SAM-dependent methyltransferase [Kibdelosporangium philippinense]|uniref:Class I SAM-dependent methyltransferase n=1 Tax=Kibdelosporangium philippinense TaxID=211113 RepID=A0ABS8ZJS3_9PSEU|nr:class I SAM-dependent methyltransferase [Kibdelosporangium philippinense]MCE7006072.1 class I SAM-dependent methyltransferase [Kibdelosporangium philippinense]
MTELYGETVFGADHDLEAMRLDALSRMFDPVMRARLVQFARPGMRCLDVGAGLGRISGWLAEVCSEVIAVDRDTRLLADLHKVFPTVRVAEADITEDLAIGTFDIVHSRLVLMHLRDRTEVFHRLADLVAPGGWLVLGEAVEAPVLISPQASPFRQLMEKHWLTLESSIGTDGQWGYRYPDLLPEAGFVDIGVEMYQAPITSTSAAGQFFQLGFHHLRDRILADGHVDRETFDEAMKAMREPGFSDLSMGLVTAWARKPT